RARRRGAGAGQGRGRRPRARPDPPRRDRRAHHRGAGAGRTEDAGREHAPLRHDGSGEPTAEEQADGPAEGAGAGPPGSASTRPASPPPRCWPPVAGDSSEHARLHLDASGERTAEELVPARIERDGREPAAEELALVEARATAEGTTIIP